MPFQPKFITEFADYLHDKSSVRTKLEWIAFKKKWFNREDWPLLTPKQREVASKVKRGPVEIGGRVWAFSYFPYDITPEARYEFATTIADLGRISLPDSQAPRNGESGWRQECPFCEIVTDQLGDEICPRCGRRLIYLRTSD